MIPMTNELRDEFNGLHAECGKVLSAVAAEKREMSAEEKESQAKRYSRMDAIKAQDEAERNHAKYAIESGAVEQVEPKGAAEFARSNGSMTIDRDSDQYRKSERASLGEYVRSGRTDKYTVTSSSGGVLIPTHVLPPITIRRLNNAFRALLGAFDVPVIETSDTSLFNLPIFDDSANVGRAPAEDETADTKLDVSPSNGGSLPATLYSSKTAWFSNTELNATGFDVLSYVTPILQKRVDVAQENAWTTAVLATTPGGQVTTASKSALTYNELLSWEHALPYQYRNDAGFVLSDSLFRLIRGMVDSNNRPIMDVNPQDKFQYSIHGKPVFVSGYMGNVGTANAIAGAFMSASSVFIRDVIPQRLTRYVNVPSQPDQTGLNLFANGGLIVNPAGEAFLKLAAT